MDMARMQAVADKTRAFYETNTAGCALLKVKEIATQPQPALCLTDYNFPKDMRRYLDDRAARLLQVSAATRKTVTGNGNLRLAVAVFAAEAAR